MLSRDLSEGLHEIVATINYLADPPSNNPSRWLQYYVNEKSRSTMRTAPHTVHIRDARPVNDELDLDREGFKLLNHESAVTNYHDSAELAQYQPAELQRLIAEVSGASDTYGVGPQLRFAAGAPDSYRDMKIARGVDTHPAAFAHGDFTDEGIHWMAELWPDLRLDAYSRFACYNVWRVISPAPQDYPLALCDARTVAAADAVDALAVMDVAGPNPYVSRAITSVFRPNPSHRWYYFSNMQPNEVIVFKSYDSDRSRASNVPHSAFFDSTCPPGTPPRASAEARIVAVFD